MKRGFQLWERLNDRDKAEIARLYVDEKWSLKRIGRRFHRHHTTILHHLERMGVPRRSLQEAQYVGVSRKVREAYERMGGAA